MDKYSKTIRQDNSVKTYQTAIYFIVLSKAYINERFVLSICQITETNFNSFAIGYVTSNFIGQFFQLQVRVNFMFYHV